MIRQTITTTHFLEPLEEIHLDWLEQNFVSISDEGDQRNVAALVYRYGRESGEAYLDFQLRTNLDVDSATVFALGQRNDKKSLVIQSLLNAYAPQPKQLNSHQRHPCHLLSALRDWRDPEIASALRHIATYNEQDAYAVLALANQDCPDCIPFYIQQFERLSAIKSEGEIGLKAIWAVGLLKLGAEYAPARKYLFQSEFLATDEDHRDALLFAIQEGRLYEAKPFLTNFLDFCLHEGPYRPAKSERNVLILHALQALGSLAEAEVKKYEHLLPNKRWRKSIQYQSPLEDKLPPLLRQMFYIGTESYKQLGTAPSEAVPE